jgi:hypothetical protein
MNRTQFAAVAKSYGKTLAIACALLARAGVTDWPTYALAVLLALFAPAGRYLDKNDPTVGKARAAVNAATGSAS